MRIITLGKYGALGNNFFRFIHSCAFAMENDAVLYYSDRKNIDKIFNVNSRFINHRTTPGILNSELLRFILRKIDKSPRLVRLLNYFNVFVHDHINRVQKDEQLALAKRRNNSIVFVLRDFRAHSSLAKMVEPMRKAFEIKPELTATISKEILDLRRNYKLLLGVHIRRGDYKEWRNGKYFFSDEVYCKKIKELVEIKGFNINDVVVLICSNGAPLMDNFSGLNVYYNPRPEHDDLFLMKQCDYIIAPPSTFSSMSSFMGSVPLYFIEADEITDFEERIHVCSY